MEKEMQHVLKSLLQKGAEYADFRIMWRDSESILVKNGEVERHTETRDSGFGIRVLYDGHWGFSASFEITPEEFERVAMQALKIAKSAAAAGGEKVKLAPQAPVRGIWKSHFKRDPFEVPPQEKLQLLLQASKEMQIPGIRVARASMDFYKEKKLFANSEGSFTDQETIVSGAGLEAVAVEGEENQVRSYPSSFGGNFSQAGYEFVEGLELVKNAKRIAEEALALLKAEQCPSGETTLILDSSQMALQIHESCGHPTELDRVLGMELGFAGGSFLTPDKRGNFRYGSEKVTIHADATCPGGIGSFGFDDDGVPAQKTALVDKGIFVGYLSSRETASKFNEPSNGTVRGEGWNSFPLIRMTNINLEPGDWSLDEMIKETEKGLYLQTNRSWSIDDKRLNFQFGTEMAYEIKNGSLGKLLKNATYTGITPEFWNNCDAVASKDFWQLWGLPNCGKGEPIQTMNVGHGASPARFQKVRVGVGKW
jgi:TldD protein